MEFIKLNDTWDADPNSPMPVVEANAETSTIKLTFYLNSFIHDDVDDDDVGELIFNDCYKYRIGPTNDHGFYLGQCRFSKTGVNWGDFYQLVNSGWEHDFPKDEIIINEKLADTKELKHYLFYFRDETFECISGTCNFRVIRK